eukprot:CAMPEP_0184526784 /NCGR_PEP_ID=MMETSP0198_2-20121128/10843_1 /TAXON_ID=1112570 /ORGANISM="Thraustochytrium sp., Strain LLF1b" /LENGTH=260 /DNA_ID=CAMNT_0026918387 /DNA_START=300 /DNA_END=1082 /DNA_ORIENTATION=-
MQRSELFPTPAEGQEPPSVPPVKEGHDVKDQVAAVERAVIELERENLQLLDAIRKQKSLNQALVQRVHVAKTSLANGECSVAEYDAQFGTSPERWETLCRELQLLEKELEPSIVLQMVLWMLLQDDAFYEQDSSFWTMICDVLQVDEVQKQALMNLRSSARPLATELREAAKLVSGAQKLAAARGIEAETIKDDLLHTLTPEQRVKFAVYMETNGYFEGCRSKFSRRVTGDDGAKAQAVPSRPGPALGSGLDPWSSERHG